MKEKTLMDKLFRCKGQLPFTVTMFLALVVWALLGLGSCMEITDGTGKRFRVELEPANEDGVTPDGTDIVAMHGRLSCSVDPYVQITDDFSYVFIGNKIWDLPYQFQLANNLELLFVRESFKARVFKSKDEVISLKMAAYGRPEVFEMKDSVDYDIKIEILLVKRMYDRMMRCSEFIGAKVSIKDEIWTLQMFTETAVPFLDPFVLEVNAPEAEREAATIALLDKTLKMMETKDRPTEDLNEQYRLFNIGTPLVKDQPFSFSIAGYGGVENKMIINTIDQFYVMLKFPYAFLNRPKFKLVDYDTKKELQLEGDGSSKYFDLKYEKVSICNLLPLVRSVLKGDLQKALGIHIADLYMEGILPHRSEYPRILAIRFERRLLPQDAARLHEFLHGRVGYLDDPESSCGSLYCSEKACGDARVRSMAVLPSCPYYLRYTKAMEVGNFTEVMMEQPILIGNYSTSHSNLKKLAKTTARRNKGLKAMWIGHTYPFSAQSTLLTSKCSINRAPDVLCSLAGKLFFQPPTQLNLLFGMIDSVFYLQQTATEAIVAISLRSGDHIDLGQVCQLVNLMDLEQKADRIFLPMTSHVFSMRPEGTISLIHKSKIADFVSSVRKRVTMKEIHEAAVNAPRQFNNSQADVLTGVNAEKSIPTPEASSAAHDKEDLMEKLFSKSELETKFKEELIQQVKQRSIPQKPLPISTMDPHHSPAQTVSLYIQQNLMAEPVYLTGDVHKALLGPEAVIEIPEKMILGDIRDEITLTLLDSTLNDSSPLLDISYAVVGFEIINNRSIMGFSVQDCIEDMMKLVSGDQFVRLIFTQHYLKLQLCSIDKDSNLYLKKIDSTEERFIAALPSKNWKLDLKLPKIGSALEFMSLSPWLRSSVTWYNTLLTDKVGFEVGSSFLVRFLGSRAAFQANNLFALLLVQPAQVLRMTILSIRIFEDEHVPGSVSVQLTLNGDLTGNNSDLLTQLMPRTKGQLQTNMVVAGKTGSNNKKKKRSADRSYSLVILSEDFPSFICERLPIAHDQQCSTALKAPSDLKNALVAVSMKQNGGISIGRPRLSYPCEVHPTKTFTALLEEPALLHRLPAISSALLNSLNSSDLVPLWVFSLYTLQIQPIYKTGGRRKNMKRWQLRFTFLKHHADLVCFDQLEAELKELIVKGNLPKMEVVPVKKPVLADATFSVDYSESVVGPLDVQAIYGPLTLYLDRILASNDPAHLEEILGDWSPNKQGTLTIYRNMNSSMETLPLGGSQTLRKTCKGVDDVAIKSKIARLTSIMEGLASAESLGCTVEDDNASFWLKLQLPSSGKEHILELYLDHIIDTI